MRDFNEVMGDFEKEVGASREDWKEIASVVTRHTGDVAGEINKVATQVERSAAFEIDEPKKAADPPNVVPFEAARPLGETTPAEADALAAQIGTPAAQNGATAEETGEEPPSAEEKPWYETERTTRTRRRRTSE
jgi:hypothetical protein